MTAAGKEWARWGDKAGCLMDYREGIQEAENCISDACRAADALGAAISVTAALRNLRKVIRELEMLRHYLERDAK